MLAMLGPRVGPYLSEAYKTIHAVAVEDKKNSGEPEESAEKPEPATWNTDGAREDQSEQKNPWAPDGKNPRHAGNPSPLMNLPEAKKPKPR